MIFKELTVDQRQSIQLTIDHYRPAIEAASDQGLYIVGQLIGVFCEAFATNPIKAMQEYFDEVEVPVKIVALPADSALNRFGDGIATNGVKYQSDLHDYDIGLPFIDGADNLPYRAWITIGRLGEFNELLEKLGISEEQNLQRLEETGMSMLRPGSNPSNAIHAPYN